MPETTELNTLRNLAQHNLRLIKDLDSELEQRRNDRTAIQERYEEQLEVLESIQSELSAMNSFMGMLEKQKGAIEAELDKITGLIHPIRRCPSDILRCIFECVVEVPETSCFMAATRLSQVCQTWRNIVLDSPVLWRGINVSLLRERMEVKVLWDRTVDRVKAAPMSIYIGDVTDEDAQWRVMDECRLDAFPHIETLEFKLTNRETVPCFASPQFHSPTGRLDKLIVQYASEDLEEPLDLSPLMGQFPSVMSLTMSELPPLTFGADFSAPSVTKLTIERTKVSSVDLLIQAFPNAEEVNLRLVQFGPHTSGTISWPTVQALTTWDCGNVPWRNLHVPSIIRLSWFNYSAADLTAFVDSHQSLRHLDASSYDENGPNAMLPAAPQLFTLMIITVKRSAMDH